MLKNKYENFRRDSHRLKGFDYSCPGFYFVTICTKDHQEYFGNIKNRKIQLNEIGKIAHKCWGGGNKSISSQRKIRQIYCNAQPHSRDNSHRSDAILGVGNDIGKYGGVKKNDKTTIHDTKYGVATAL